MQSITTFFIEENDFLYRKGFKKGFREGLETGIWKAQAITNLIAKSDLPDEQIASIAEVPVSLVESIRAVFKKLKTFH